jgi:hypothetical protein
MIDFGAYAEMRVDGQRFSGLAGEPLQPRFRAPAQPEDPLEQIMKLQGVTDAGYVGEETVRGTLCHVVAVRAGSAELTVWIDDAHIRRIRSAEHASDEHSSVSKSLTIELSAPRCPRPTRRPGG